MAVYIHKLEFN